MAAIQTALCGRPMSTNYLAAEVAWREVWRLAEESKVVPMGTKAREAADAAFSQALGQALAALDHPLATLRARLADACIATVAHVAELQSAALTLTEDSPDRDQTNADAIAAYVELGRAIGIERMLEERVASHVGQRVPEAADERTDYFQEAAALVTYDIGGLLPRVFWTLAGGLVSLPEGHRLPLMEPRKLGRGEAGTSRLEDRLQQMIALRVLLESLLAGEAGSAWVERTKPGISRRSYERWLASAAPEDRASVETLADKTMRQEPLSAGERQLHDLLTRRPLRQMIEGLAHTT